MRDFKIRDNLKKVEKDALLFAEKLSTSNAAESLSMMIKKTVSMNVSSIKILNIEDVSKGLPNVEEIGVGVFLRIKGDAPGSILIFFDRNTKQTRNVRIALEILCNILKPKTRRINKIHPYCEAIKNS